MTETVDSTMENSPSCPHLRWQGLHSSRWETPK